MPSRLLYVLTTPTSPSVTAAPPGLTPLADTDSNAQTGYDNPDNPDSDSTAPVRYIDGLPLVNSVDLESDGFGSSFGIERSWTSLNEGGQIGNGWMITNLPYLVVDRPQYVNDHSGVISIMEGGQTQESFDISDSTNVCQARYGSQDTLVYTPSATVDDVVNPGYFTFTDAKGNIITFYDVPRTPAGEPDDGTAGDTEVTGRVYGGTGKPHEPIVTGGLASYPGSEESEAESLDSGPTQTMYQLGAFRSMQDAAGNLTTTDYDQTTGNLTDIIRTDPSDVQEQFYFEYDTLTNSVGDGASASVISKISLERRPSISDSWTTVRTAEYSYYTGEGDDSANGRFGDLKSVIVKDYQQNPESPVIVQQDYYRYNKFSGTGLSAGGFEDHGPTNDPSTTGGTDPFYSDNFVSGDTQVMSGLKFVVEGGAYDELAAQNGATSVDDINALSDADIAQYAQYHFQYERYQMNDVISVGPAITTVTRYRVISETAAQNGCSVCANGFGTFTYSYTVNPNGPGVNDDSSSSTWKLTNDLQANTWVIKNVETLPDGTDEDSSDNDQIITYVNEVGEVLLTDVVSKNGTDSTGDDTNTLTWYRYDDQGRLIMEAHPSALTGYSDSLDDLVGFGNSNYTYLSAHTGLVEEWDYSSTTTSGISATSAGNAAGYLQEYLIQNGANGTAIPQEAYTYYKVTASSGEGGATIFPIATDTVYANNDGTGARETQYSYTYYTDTVAVKTQTMTAPVPPLLTSQRRSLICTAGRLCRRTVMDTSLRRATIPIQVP